MEFRIWKSEFGNRNNNDSEIRSRSLFAFPSSYNLKILNSRFQIPNSRSGFTVLELVISLAIFLVIAAAAMPIYNKLYTSSRTNATATEFAQALRTARQRSVAGLNGATHGVYVEADKYTIYQDSTTPFSFATRDISYDRVTTLDSSITLSPVQDVVFTKGSGVNVTPVNFTLTHTDGSTQTVSVNQFGAVSNTPIIIAYGGPILIIEDATRPFTTYYKEILLAEGLNMYERMDIGAVNAGVLVGFDIAILGDIDLTDAQVTILTDWVNAGGRLIAMSPDVLAPGSLAGLLGLTGAACTTLSNAYWNIDTTAAPGAGIVTSTIQFHGDADNCTLSGATEVATLYSNISTSLSKPAVITRLVGGNGGQAAAFMFDLARSVVYTRQGNPAWAGDERDGIAPKRPNDLFYGAKTGDVQPDWVNLANIAIPQADESQRLLVNMIQNMLATRRPIPHFWYLPFGEKAVILASSDDHNANATVGSFDTLKTQSVPGCVVADWACFRSTSWMYTANAMTDAQANGYRVTDGFEMGVHVDNVCADWTPASLRTEYDSIAAGDNSLPGFQAKYVSLPAQKTHRFHCIVWSDWSTHATVNLERGIRLNEDYYYWANAWPPLSPGFMTGSGLPMRFADISGNIIDVYQQATHLVNPNDSGIPSVTNITALVNKARGAEGYYGIFGTHYDFGDTFFADLWGTAKNTYEPDVKLVTALQVLDWTDGKNASSFSCSTKSSCSVSWNPTARRLSFTLAYDVKARGLNTLVPSTFGGFTISAVRKDGVPISPTYTIETIKGISYARFASTGGAYEVDYN